MGSGAVCSAILPQNCVKFYLRGGSFVVSCKHLFSNEVLRSEIFTTSVKCIFCKVYICYLAGIDHSVASMCVNLHFKMIDLVINV